MITTTCARLELLIVKFRETVCQTLFEVTLQVKTYRNLSKIRPWGMNLRSSSKREVGILLRVVIFLSKICPPHTRLVYPCVSEHVAILQFVMCSVNGVWLHLLVPLLAQCCFFGALVNITNCMYYGINIGRCTFERKAPFTTTSFKVIFKGGPIFERL